MRPVSIELRRDPGSAGAGGGDLDFEFEPDGQHTEASLKGIPTRGGPGNRYRCRFNCLGYKIVSFSQYITEGAQWGIQTVYLPLDTRRVRDIGAPNYANLKPALKSWLSSAAMIAPKPEDQDLVGKSGRDLYTALGPVRKAALLNLFKKSRHKGTVGNVFDFFGELMLLRPDRLFVGVEAGLRDYVAHDSRFVPAPDLLHKPLPGYQLSDSVKSQDAHANLQITLQVSTADGHFAADVDIDEASGFDHWGEVLRNFFTKQRTNPYAVHELLLAADPIELKLDPDYELVLAS